MRKFNKKEALEAILKRPAMYMGNTAHPFTAMLCFLRGLEIGLGCGANNGERGVFPKGFYDWARKKLDWNHPTQRWDNGLLERCDGDEAKAFELYRDLILEYLNTHPEDGEE